MSPSSNPVATLPELGLDIWSIILSHVKRPLPLPGAPVGRKGWHQADLAACLRVNKVRACVCQSERVPISV